MSQSLSLAAEFRPFNEVDIHAKVAGYLKEVRFDVGDRVRQGQLIAMLEIPEFESDLKQAAASRKRGESDVLRAQSEVRRAQSIYDAARLTHSRLAAIAQSRPNLLAQQELDDSAARAQVADAQLSASKAALTVAEEQVRVLEANEAKVKTLAAYAAITAPFSGIVTRRFADKGALIQQGTASQTQAMPVVRLSQVDRLRLVLPVPESVAPRIRIGRLVKVRVPSLNQTFDGRVARFVEKVDTTTRTMETEVDVPNARSILKPGMYAYADLELDNRSDAITAPVQAISRKEKSATVMIVNAGMTLELREVILGLETPDSVEILSGLAVGDLVVVGNLSQLKPGQRVTPKEMATGAEQKERGH
ncbi:MAG: efflux RND transporter periplasmic adaptor subunit [Blastocatellia bacterium]|nr:efflux RND transporter periplasmic adaptor subunit [Blastocatellia bacterium]